MDFRKIEEETIEKYRKSNVIELIKEKNKEGPKFFFLDGPPFVTNEIHQGTLYGYYIKDSVLRYKIMQGFNVRMQPGWDTQGLPIEVIVQKNMHLESKKDIEAIGIDKFVQSCKTFVDDLITKNTELFIKSGILLHLEKPYVTYANGFISGVWGIIKKAYELGLLEEDLEPTWYCIHCETPLANYETKDKYIEKEDPSLFFLLKLKDSEDYLLVWTTTPWTIPSNVAVAIDPNEEYEEVEVGGKKVIIAAKREKEVFERANKEYKVIRKFKGSELLGKKYEHPFADIPQVKPLLNTENFCIVIDGSSFKGEEETPFVEMDEGTGLVHVAPGHGITDYAISRQYGLPLLSPVDSKGIYTEEAGWLKGTLIWEGNNKVIEYLKEKGLVFHLDKIRHRYPICWRCKNPLITRASKQWFLRVKKLRKELVKALEDTNWYPIGSKEMMRNWLENISDWVISRQRYWGAPLPVWKCKNGHIRVIGSKEELEAESNTVIEDLHRPYVDRIVLKCKECGEEMRRVEDTLDVWIDSGSASFAIFGGNKQELQKWYPADFITEGHDQIRGWFYSLLVLGYIFSGSSPYKNVLMHRFVVGEDKQKLSKSLGNYTPLNEFYAKGYSSDALRLSLLIKSPDDNIIYKLKDVEDQTKVLNILVNLANLYLETKKVKFAGKVSESSNLWIIHKWIKTKNEVINAMENYSLHTAIQVLEKFLIEDFSQTYVKFAKEDIFERELAESAYVFSKIMEELVLYMSVFAPLISEYVYNKMFDKDFVVLERLPSPSTIKDLEYEGDLENESKKVENSLKIISWILRARNKLGLNIRRPIKNITLPFSDKVRNHIDEELIKRAANIFSLSFLNSPSSLDEKFINGELSVEEFAGLNIDYKTLKNVDGMGVDDELSEEVLKEWQFREISRAIQDLRKKLHLTRESKAKIEIKGEIDRNVLERIMRKTNTELGKGEKGLNAKVNIYNKEFEINIYE